MVEAALVLCMAISEELVTAMLFTITLVEGIGGAKAELVVTAATVVVVAGTGTLVYDVSTSPQEELMSVKSVMAKETCAVKEQTFSDLATKNNTRKNLRVNSSIERTEGLGDHITH